MADDDLFNFLESGFDDGETFVVNYEDLPIANHLNVGLASVINKEVDEDYFIFDFTVQNRDEPIRVLVNVKGGIARSITSGDLGRKMTETP